MANNTALIQDATAIISNISFIPQNQDNVYTSCIITALNTRGSNRFETYLIIRTTSGYTSVKLKEEVFGGEESLDGVVLVANTKQLGAVVRFMCNAYNNTKEDAKQRETDIKNIVGGEAIARQRIKPASKSELLLQALKKERNEKDELKEQLEKQAQMIAQLQAMMEERLANN